jgi:hypothetical protein
VVTGGDVQDLFSLGRNQAAQWRHLDHPFPRPEDASSIAGSSA